MDLRTVKDNLSRSKLYATKGSFEESLKLLLMGMQGLCKNPSFSARDTRTIVREILQVYLTDTYLLSLCEPFKSLISNFNAGQEKTLYTEIKKVYETVSKKVVNENYHDAKERKANLDKYLMWGKKYLSESQFAKADEMYKVAITFYKNEKGLFIYIAKSFMDAKQNALAISYLKKELEINPNSEEVKLLMEEISKK